jgi:cyclic pyranopterin phosphate synthase
MLIDRFGRQITYLRISITDRCNMRCVYCMPPEGILIQPHEKIMRFEEIVRVARVAAENGILSMRLTGGEPLLRHDLPELVSMIAEIPQVDDISITTNGLLLEEKAKLLAEAGLRRVNISLDTLDPEKFKKITRGGSLEKVWRGVAAAEKYGLQPIKINVVAMKGINDDEIIDLARLSLTHNWTIRFIELMPVKNQAAWGDEFPTVDGSYYISVHEMLDLLSPLGLNPIEQKTGRGPAKEYHLDRGIGKIGFISPIGEHFCDTCNRLRLTADGNLRSCLLNDAEVPILQKLREGEPILPLLEEAVHLKPEGHELLLEHLPQGRCMRQIGG